MGVNRNLRKAAKAPSPSPHREFGPIQFKYQRLPDMANGDHRPFVVALVQADVRNKLGMFYVDPTAEKTQIDDDAALVMKLGPDSGSVKIYVQAVDGRTLVHQKPAAQLVSDVLENHLMTGVLGADWFGSYEPVFDDRAGVMTLYRKG